MDPITAIGLLASLANLMHASKSLLEIVKSLKDGDRELLELFNDVSVFEEALKGFDRVLRSRQTKHNISAAVLGRALEEASSTVQELESKLHHMSRSEVSAIRRIKWVQHKSSLKKLHERVKEQSTMLQSFLSLAHAYVPPYS
jgi:predicted RNase H-like nuclease (RuvC/YqgF family)